MSNLSIAIQHTPAHRDRVGWVQAMTEQLRAEDPYLALRVVEDRTGAGCWPTHRRALEAAGSASHHLVLQDDVALCGDFLASVAEAIRTRPNQLISLYTNSAKVHEARARGEAWIVDYGCGPAVIWPSHLIGEFLAWEAQYIDPGLEWDDVRVSMWLTRTARESFATVPSLVEHLGWAASTLGQNHPSKVAAWWIGRDRSAVQIDWTRGHANPLVSPCKLDPRWWAYCREEQLSLSNAGALQ